MSASAFFATINGFDVLLVAIAICIGYYASIQGDLADKWKATAHHYETQYSASEEFARDLCYKYDKLYDRAEGFAGELFEIEDRVRFMGKYLDHTNLWQEYYAFVDEERARQFDPWSAPPQTPRKATQEDLDQWAKLV